MKKHLILSLLLAFIASFAVQAQTPGREAAKARTEKQSQPAKATPGGVAKAKKDADAKKLAKQKAVKKHKKAKKAHVKKAPGMRVNKRHAASTTSARPVIRKTTNPADATTAKSAKVQPAYPANKTARMRQPQSMTKARKTAPSQATTRPTKMQPQPAKPQKITPDATRTTPKDAKMAPAPAQTAPAPVKATPGALERARQKSKD